jgi:hypothetical protein
MQIFKSKLAKLKKGVGVPVYASNIGLLNGVSMHQLPNRWFKVEADNAPVSKVERIEAALQLIEKVVVHGYSLNEPAQEADETEPVVANRVHGGGHSAKTPPSQLLVKMFSRIGF